MIQNIKGTQDLLDLSLYTFLLSRIRKHLGVYNFTEIKTPILEPLELFQRSLGLHTDVVSKEMYTVCTGHEDTSSICLRPEATASTMRAFYNNAIEQRPWKVFSAGPMFRHERPQKGRYRQFHQISIETIGAESIAYDAQLIAMLDRFISNELNLEEYALHINFLGSPEDRETYKKIVNNYLDLKSNLPKAIQERRKTNLLRIFDLKDPECQAVLEDAPAITDHLSETSMHEWEQLQLLLDQLSISYSINHRLVRGLDYYNKTVFEFSSPALGAQNAFCGGGRYDHLSQELGEKEAVPALGAAFGIERLLILMEWNRQRLNLPHKPALAVIIPLAVEQQALALLCADELHAHGICCETILDVASVKSMMRKANKLGASSVLLIGEDEMKNNYITIKTMQTGDEQKVKQADIVQHLKK